MALLDSDDVLPEQALFWVAHEINQHPDVDLIYSDEDKVNEAGIRFDPYFKPDWNPALMLSQNHFNHLGVYRLSLVKEVGGFREGLEGSQDWDLVLRCSEKTTLERIRHIPRILYHWRAIPGSAALESSAKPYAWTAGKRAIEEHLERMGTPGIANRALVGCHHQVSYLSKGIFPTVRIIIPSRCKLSVLKPCLESILCRSTYPHFEILLVVNGIQDAVLEQAEYLDGISVDPRVKILVYKDQPFNYSRLNNWAIAQSGSSILCLMNDDTEVITDDWLEKLVTRLQIPGVAAVGSMLLYPDNRIQHAGVILGLGGVAGHQFVGLPNGHGGYFGRAGLEQDLSCVTAACMVVQRKAFDSIGGFNENLAIAFNDVDLCIRLRKSGWRIIWTPEAKLFHHESASVGAHNSPERSSIFQAEVALMRELWGGILDADPFFNPNLSLNSSNHDLAFPPRVSKLP
ncbi:glycosyl transferase, group 2 family protein [mine drainage metagenome]|uniref:Glycosyl transferase, group 2 family protein n=1 Tax=mine drainage metagenome TaxID=410659 RepID=T1CJX5_9ZZZZ